MGIYTLLKLRRTSLSPLLAEFGKVEGTFLYHVGQGIDTRDVVPYTQAPAVKSVSRHYCLPENEFNKRKVLQHIYELCEEVGIKLRRLHKKARTGGIFLHGEHSLGGHLSHDYYFDSGADLFTICREIINRNRDLFDTGYIRRIAVWTGNLEESRAVPISLFCQEQRKQRLIEAVDRLNEKFGDHTIRNGFLLYADKLTTVPNGWLSDRYERVKLAESAI
jgi:nucleotidyltransferase/DNA polymerase involved in DNA repair